MKKSEVEIGGKYKARVSRNIVTVQILRTSAAKGWIALNLDTGREVYIKTAARLRERVDA